MAKQFYYYVRRIDGLYLQGIESNDNYSKNACAPTMGTRHSFCEYKAVWGRKKKEFEPLTLTNYIRVILEEYRWESSYPFDFAVHISNNEKASVPFITPDH